jgi:putative membrane protein
MAALQGAAIGRPSPRPPVEALLGQGMMTDLLLTIAHHLLVFALVAILATELAVVRPGMAADRVRRLAAMDATFGVLAGLIIVVGFARVFWGAKGAEFFLTNHWFWAKMATFVAVGLFSIPPTMRFIRWRNRLKAEPGFVPAEDEVRAVRRFMHVEAFLLFLIPVFAAVMVRAYAF